MSEAYRHEYLRLKNRLEELLAKHGPLPEEEAEAADLLPSWGPLGSLARLCMDEHALQRLLALDRDMARKRPPQGPRGAGW